MLLETAIHTFNQSINSAEESVYRKLQYFLKFHSRSETELIRGALNNPVLQRAATVLLDVPQVLDLVLDLCERSGFSDILTVFLLDAFTKDGLFFVSLNFILKASI